VGTEADPFLQEATITLHGDRLTTVELPFFGAKVLAVADKGGMTGGHGSVADVPESQKGVLDLHGRPRLKRWTRVAPPGVVQGEKCFTVSEPVDFEAGDRIIVTVAHEIRTVESLGNGGVTVCVTEPFDRTHDSVIQEYSHQTFSPSANEPEWTVDMRCEVGLLNSNVKVQGNEESTAQYFGCHTVAMHGGHYRLENIEIQRCGQAGNLGRYSTHFHVNGPNPAPDSYVKSNSIHDSFQRGTTVHSTTHALVQDNLYYNNMGHNVFVEDGDEEYNIFDGNIVIASKNSPFMLKSDAMHASFWTATPSNMWRNNVAVESQDRGMWFEFCDSESRVCAESQDTYEFTNNIFHHNNGIGW
jgi:hypothetical protein